VAGAGAGARVAAAGVVVAKEAAAAGPRLGSLVAASAAQQLDGSNQASAPAPVPPHVADPTLAATSARKE
jgi:hypothetical protein